MVPPMVEANDVMTWHDQGGGQETRLSPAYANHSGTLLTVLSVLRCRKYHPQTANSIYVGRTYDVIRDFHEDGAAPGTHASRHYQLPLARLKMIQPLMVTKTNVCPHPKPGCVIAVRCR
eukprot:5108142-Amphidinium_carterae.2